MTAAPIMGSLPPQPAYNPSPTASPTFLSSIPSSARTLQTTHHLPPRSGLAFSAPATSIIRISTPEGPQVGDLNIWNLHNPRERFWASRTRQLHASHVTVGDRLWSCLPYLRPMVTIVGDTLGKRDWAAERGGGKGVSRWGGKCHDLLGTRCDPYVNKLLSGSDFDYQCHSNLTRAILPYGLNESDVHDVLNVFQVTGLDMDGKYFMEPCPANPGDYFELFAEIDVLCALSTCPGGDLSAWGWTASSGAAEKTAGDDPMLATCRPLKVEIFKLNDPSVLNDWKPPERPAYKGMHGMSIPQGQSRGKDCKEVNV